MNGYVDLQVNGFAGVDFNNDELTVSDIRSACDALNDDGAHRFLPTVITASLDQMRTRIGVLAGAIEKEEPATALVAGIHVEGPFISPADGYVGAHPRQHVLPASIDAVQSLVDAGQGHVRLVTLAPETDPDCRVITWLADRGIAVAGGHSDASLTQLSRAADAGMKMFTHLGNGCPGELPRHDNIIQRVLTLAEELMISFIADGHHVPFFALANYLEAIPDENVIVVSDAIGAAGQGEGTFTLSGQPVFVDSSLAAWSANRIHFAGSATPVSTMRRLMKDRLGIDDETIEKWTVGNPRRLLDG
ncbi:MAG: N-acetylglucosamine-6-phosphate deacetylase [Planctomycetota bacterium]